jgi:hypothetical protein
MPKSFEMTWTSARYSEWLAMVRFWRSVYGSANAFYWQFPIELYGVGGWGGQDGFVEDPGGWDAEGEGFDYNEGPVFLVRFAKDSFQQQYEGPVTFGWNVGIDEVA